MRFTYCLLAALLLASPTLTLAQYDFDDFLNAVESGKAKSNPQTPFVPRVAQLHGTPATRPYDDAREMLETPSILEDRDVPTASILPTPEPELAGDLSNQVPMTQAPVNQVPAGRTPSGEVAPGYVDFGTLFAEEASLNFGLAAPNHHGCQSCAGGTHHHGGTCAVMPYRQANLPAPSTLHGYFNASPCIAHLWDDYACEAAADCAKQFGRPCQITGHVYECGAGCLKPRCD